MNSSNSLYDNVAPLSFKQPDVLPITLPANGLFSTAITVTSCVFGYKNGEIISRGDRIKYTTESTRILSVKKRVYSP